VGRLPLENASEQRGGFARKWNDPTQANGRLEWATPTFGDLGMKSLAWAVCREGGKYGGRGK